MINRTALLSDLQSVLRKLEADLLERTASSEVPEVGEWLRAEYERAKKGERTAQNYEDWRSDAITQAAAAWVLSCVFVRFLEDNRLIDPPKVSGQWSVVSGQSENRLQQARDEHELYFRAHPTETDREYLLAVFDELARLPGTKDVFGEHNPFRELPAWLSGDAAGELLRFFQKIDANTGDLIHDFSERVQGSGFRVQEDQSPETCNLKPETSLDTRFLGDLYQDLSEAARKKYALLQTPDFVEEFILDRTLDPALDEFGLEPGKRFQVSGFRVQEPETCNLKPETFRMIDPACGSGHFLLGAFPRILNRWQKQEPGTNIRELVQRTLNSIHGVDINPFAIAIARFRLLLAALKACDIKRLKDAPAFTMNLACGDSLYHGRQRQQTLGDWTDESHYFRTEDAENLRRILQEGTFHAVVANPPYIVPKDRAANEAYRKLYPQTCHMKYSLAVPFMERILRLAVGGRLQVAGSRLQEEAEPETCNLQPETSSGFTGQITANSFMKREFGKKLIEAWFPKIDLTHVIDTSGAYIPGHGTPTVILLARNQKPVSSTIRTVLGIRGEPSTPADPAQGLVWSAIVELIDRPGGGGSDQSSVVSRQSGKTDNRQLTTDNPFVSVGDSSRELFHKHPWSIGGGGASELKEALEAGTTETLSAWSESIGFMAITGEDEVFVMPRSQLNCHSLPTRPFCVGDVIRDWSIETDNAALVPYDYSDEKLPARKPTDVPVVLRYLWPCRSVIRARNMFGKTVEEHGFEWFEFMQFIRERATASYLITFAFVATHNHFVLDRGGKVFNRSAPVIKLPAEVATADGETRPVTEDDHLALLGLLNSSTACFWMKQVFHDKGSTVDSKGARQTTVAFENFREFTGTGLLKFPLPEGRPVELARRLDDLAQQLQASAPGLVISGQFSVVSQKATDNRQLTTDNSSLRETLSTAHSRCQQLRGLMIFLQEELDWECYRLYGMIDERLQGSGFRVQEEQSPETCNLKPELSLSLGERAFEIVLARKMASGETQTTWFDRHGSTPITELPAQWPEEYSELVARRIEVIESNPEIALIEQPEYKRRWNTEPWDSQVERALRSWLLDRLESYFDFDGRMKEGRFQGSGSRVQEETEPETCDLQPATSPPLSEIALVSVARLADVAAKDVQFSEVASVYRDDPAFDVQRLVAELVGAEHVPLLPVLRYKPSGLRKRKEWEKTWELQREEDRFQGSGFRVQEGESETRNLKPETSIPVPPKYKSSDFISTGGARYWSLRGKLDVPKERWVSFPHCEGSDGTLMIAWAGYNHLQLAQAISAYYVDVQERLGGAGDPRLIPLLAGVIELLPWLKQWHHDLDPEYNQRMDEVYEGFVTEEAKGLNLTIEEIKAWEPPKKPAKRARKKNS